jgi:hypothetical protein
MHFLLLHHGYDRKEFHLFVFLCIFLKKWLVRPGHGHQWRTQYVVMAYTYRFTNMEDNREIRCSSKTLSPRVSLSLTLRLHNCRWPNSAHVYASSFRERDVYLHSFPLTVFEREDLQGTWFQVVHLWATSLVQYNIHLISENILGSAKTNTVCYMKAHRTHEHTRYRKCVRQTANQPKENSSNWENDWL